MPRAYESALLASACCLLLATGCASFPAPPAFASRAGGASTSGLVTDRPPESLLRVGDELVITVTSGSSSKTRSARIDARGEAHVGAGRDLRLKGLSLEKAEARVTDVVHERDRLAQVDLRLSPQSQPRFVALGALAKQGAFVLEPGMRVVDAVGAAGGLLGAPGTATNPIPSLVADLEGAVLVRDGVRLPVNLELALRGAAGHNVYLQPGDQLWVPFGFDRKVAVLGEVGSPAVLTHRPGLRLTQALAQAGGITPGGDKADIRIIRGPLERPAVYRASLSDIAGGHAQDAQLRAGDVVFVTDDPIEDFGEVLRIVTPAAAIGVAVLAVLLLVPR